MFPLLVLASSIRGDTVDFYPSNLEIRGVGNAIWEDEDLIIYGDVIIVDLVTGNVVAFGNVTVENDNRKEYYDVFSMKGLNLNIIEGPVIPYISAKEIDIDWRTTTITLKDVRISQDIILPVLSMPFGPYSSGVNFAFSKDETISLDTSSPYILINLPYEGGIFTEVLNQTGMDILYQKEDYYFIGLKAHIDSDIVLFGEYTFYFDDNSLGFTLGYNGFFYTGFKKEVRDGLWRYIEKGTIDWKAFPKVLFSIEASKWDRLILKGEFSIDTGTGGIIFKPYIGYKTDISKDLTLNVCLSSVGIDNIAIIYHFQPSLNLRLGYINPQTVVFGADWGYRSLDIEYNNNLNIILK
ncbi:MAG: hypothetical protein ACP5PC_04190 [bacterium]